MAKLACWRRAQLLQFHVTSNSGLSNTAQLQSTGSVLFLILLLSDAASYMTACTAALKVLYPYLFHMTCTAHMLHNCAEKVRNGS